MESMATKQHPFSAHPYTTAHFCGASTHIDCLRSREQAFRGTADERGGCRPGGDAGGQFKSKYFSDERVLRPSAHRARPWRARECLSSHFLNRFNLGIFFKINTDVNEDAIDWGHRDPYILVFVNLLHSFSTVTLCHTSRDTSAAMSKLRS